MRLINRTWALLAVLIVLTVLLVTPGTVAAHTGFESSSPSNGEMVDQPVEVVTIVFTGDATPVGEEFVALDPSGQVRVATSIVTTDQRTFVVTFDPPLAGGDIGVRWHVQAADAHPIEGAFQFTVTAPAPTTVVETTVSSATTAPTVTALGTETTPPDTQAAAVAVEDSAPSDQDNAQVATGAVSEPSPDVTSAVALDDFLMVDTSTPGDTRQLVGRILSLPAVGALIGALAILMWVLRGTRAEIVGLVHSVRIAGCLAIVGAMLEYLGSNAATLSSFASGWRSTPGLAMALRMVGAVLVVIGVRIAFVRPKRSLSAAVIEQHPPVAESRTALERWSPQSSKLAAPGVILLVTSFWFDGHTVSKGWQPLHAVVNSVHVLAGSIWFGGVVTIAALVWWRHRRGQRTRGGELVVRFSPFATIALIAVAGAGLVMAVLVLDGFGEITGTEWGQILLLKTAAVALAASCGAYNHFRLKPLLLADPHDVDAQATLRSVLTAEAILLTFVVVVTAWLVAAAS